MSSSPTFADWLHCFFILGISGMLIAAAAALVCCFTSSAVWQRTVWQAGILAFAILAPLELFGMTHGLLNVFRSRAVELAPAASDDPPNLMAAAPAETVFLPLGKAFTADATTFEPQAAPSDEFAGAPVKSYPSHHGISQNHAASADTLPVHRKSSEVVRRSPALVGKPEPTDHVSELASIGTTNPPVGRLTAWAPGVVWLLGTFLVTIRIGWAHAVLAFYRARCRGLPPASLQTLCDDLSRRLGLRRTVKVLEWEHLAGPVALGVLRPAVAAPAGFTTRFEPREQQVIMAHELAHVAARDPVWRLLADVACALFWWHPASWWSRRRLLVISETAADEASLLLDDGPNLLAACLVVLGRQVAGPGAAVWARIEGDGFRSVLGRRVQRLLTLRMSHWRPVRRGRLFFARVLGPTALVVAAVVISAGARPAAFPYDRGDSTMMMQRQSWRTSLAGMAIVAMFAGSAVADADDGTADNVEVEIEVSDDALEASVNLLLVTLADRDDDEEADDDAFGDDLFGEVRFDDDERDHDEGDDDDNDEARRHAERRADSHAEEARRQHSEFREHFDQVRREIEELVSAGKREAADKMRRHLDELHERFAGQRRHHDEQLEQFEQRRRHLEELHEQGRHDEAERLAEELREFERRRGGDDEGRRSADETMRRVRHLHAAAENLHAAGLHDQAENVLREARNIEWQLDRHEMDRNEERRHAEHRRDQQRDGEPSPDLARAVAELQEQMHDLRRGMEEMRHHLEQMTDRSRRDGVN